MTDEKRKHRDRVQHAVRNFLLKARSIPWLAGLNRGKFGQTLYFDDEFWRGDSRPDKFEFDPETEKQHTVVMRYFSLLQTPEELRDLEFYFRRFPYSGTPITRHTHLSNWLRALLRALLSIQGAHEGAVRRRRGIGRQARPGDRQVHQAAR